jgi:hypothetical protein
MNSLRKVYSYFFGKASKVQSIIKKMEKCNGISVKITHHEELIKESRGVIRSLIHFLGEEASTRYLESCADLIFNEQKRTRRQVSWTDSLIRRIEDQIEELQYLPDYKFEVSE